MMSQFRSLAALVLLAVATQAADEGKVFLRSDPNGAEVLLVTANGEKSLGKTANLFKLPLGKNALKLKLANYKDATTEIEVNDAAIVKPDPVKLEPITYAVDIIILEEGWQIAVDKQPQTKDGQPVAAPATLNLPFGKHEIRLTKNGFADITKTVDVAKAISLEIKDKPMKVTSTLIPQTPKIETAVLGKWRMTGIDGWKGTFEFTNDHIILFEDGKSSKWQLKDDLIITNSKKEVWTIKNDTLTIKRDGVTVMTGIKQ